MACNGRGAIGSRIAQTGGKTGSIAGRTAATSASTAAGATGAKTTVIAGRIAATGVRTVGIGGGDVQSGSAYAMYASPDFVPILPPPAAMTTYCLPLTA